ncbi:MAG: ankyrin repeat domain-containing protein [Fimbriimonas sp.]
MTQTLPEKADFRHLRDEARTLLDALHAAEPDALALAAAHDPKLEPAKALLADAQRLTARKYGFPSWTRLKTEVETPRLVEEFKRHVQAKNAAALDSLLKKSAAVRRRIDEPIFSFDAPAIVNASSSRPVAEVLLRHGANPNARSKWWAGGFGALDFASPESVEVLLDRGARFDVWSAAAQGRATELAALLDADPSQVNAPGGDGMRPLHFASTVEVAQLLLDRGADPELRDVDHEGTAAQHQIGRPEIARLILDRGGKPDIFLATVLDDAEMLNEILSRDPSAIEARTGHGEFSTRESDGGHIYLYNLGGGKTPLQVASERNLPKALAILNERSAPNRRLVAACIRNDAATADRLLAEHPGLRATLDAADLRALPDAAAHGNLAAVELMLRAGFDPNATGMDTGTALHTAAWFGQAEVVARLAGLIDVNLRDAHHGSTPLGWAAHGGHWCRNPKGDYVRTVEILLDAGADIHATANSGGTPILKQAGDREDVKAVLRQRGAR